jgi:AcrR family transcriptional regulator
MSMTRCRTNSNSTPAHTLDTMDSAADGDDARDGRSTRWDPHRRERRLRIINAAIDAIEEHGPDVLTAQVAEKADVPRTHVYRHFEGKQALDLAVSSHIANQIGQRIRVALATRGSVRAIISASIDEHLSWIEQHPNLYRFLAQHAYTVRSTGSHKADDAKAAFATELTALVERYVRVLGADPSPVERTIVGVVGLVDTTAAWWLDSAANADAITPSRPELTTELTDRVWLIIARSGEELGLSLDPDARLPSLPKNQNPPDLHSPESKTRAAGASDAH